MKDNVKLKKLKSFFYKNLKYAHDHFKLIVPDMKRELEYHRSISIGILRNHRRRETLESIQALETALRYIEELKLNNDELKEICKEMERKWELYAHPHRSSQPVHPNRARDNKVHTTYGYSSTCSRVRFPSLKRGRSTWKRFYEMFPRIAEEDKWDGRTSTRYRPLK